MATSLAVAGNAAQQQLMGLSITPVLLDSWKEIASFFARTIRTVQRWETAENLPVYRHLHEKRSTVYAFESELMAWRDTRSLSGDQSILGQKTASRRLRLAVLPFANLSSGSQLRHFEDGLTHELIAQLARLDPARLGVIARASVMPYKKTGCNIAQISRRLNLDYILEGSVRLAAQQVRITAQLIDVHDQTHLFADTCTRRWVNGELIQIAFAERMARMVCKHLLAPSKLSGVPARSSRKRLRHE
jgi:TolB-like protein